MNVLWIVSDTFRQDHLGAYGKKPDIRTPALDFLASRSVRFDRHYVSAFPTMPARADFATGRWTMSFMGWEPLPDDVETLAELLSENGVHTAATVDTPFYIRRGMNYDRGFQSFRMHAGQQTSFVRVGNQSLKDQAEARDTRDDWRYESDTNVAQTAIKAMQWLERHYKEDFFLLVDVWDPHEPWEAPLYYTKLYMPDYSGEEVPAAYGYWRDVPGMTEEKVRKAHAAYCGEVTLVDTWLGNLLGMVERMGLMDNTAIIFTSDHGFYYGEHGLFGKMNLAKRPDATPEQFIQAAAPWDRSPSVRGGDARPATRLRTGSGTGSLRRADVCRRSHAHRSRSDGPGDTPVGRGQVASANGPGPFDAGPGVHHNYGTLRQSGRPGALRRPCTPQSARLSGHHYHGRRVGAALRTGG